VLPPPAPPAASHGSGERLFITGIPQDVTQEEVQAYFAQFGTWSDIYMPRGNYAAGHKGICFISFNGHDCVTQVLNTGPHHIRGQPVIVDVAAPRDAPKGKGKDGGFGKGGGGYKGKGGYSDFGGGGYGGGYGGGGGCSHYEYRGCGCGFSGCHCGSAGGGGCGYR